jgi:CheY-like chemotaxis protein
MPTVTGRAARASACAVRVVMRSAVVLDDTPEARAMIVTELCNEGFDVLEAATGEEALELAHSRAPDLIIANPLIAGMDSDEFALALGADPVITRTPVGFCAETRDAREVWCLAEACDVSHILIKPCEPDDIARFVGEILGPEPDAGAIVPARLFEREQL